MVTESLPPNDISAEESVIGSVLIDGESLSRVTGFLKAEDFYGQKNRWCFEACSSIMARGEAINQVTLIVLMSLIVGKTVGVTLFSLAAERMGFPLPQGMAVKHLAIAALSAGIGLTVALFMAGKAFAGPPFQDPAKMGAVLSVFVGVLALTAGAIAKVKDGDE